MNARVLLAAAGLLVFTIRASAVDPRQRTDMGQFSIYCADANLRRQVASFASQTKADLLALLGQPDAWKRPILVTIDHAAAPNPAAAPATLRLVESEVGMKIEIFIRLSREPADVNLQKFLVRAVLLEAMYRKDGVPAGQAYAEPPWWILDGLVELLRQRDNPPDARFFRTLVETNKLPPVERFLTEKPDELGPTALAVDRALAMCLVQLLLDQPDGRRHLAALLRSWPAGSGDPVEALGREFPGLAGGAPALQKWWTLNLARFAAANRSQPLTAEETDRELGALLEFEVASKDGAMRHFKIGEFAEYVKLPASRAVLAGQRAALVALSARSNGLLLPALAEYVEDLAQLARGKTRGIAERLAHAARLRAAVVRRADEIADYLNWFEASQMSSRSNAFDAYLKTAGELSEQGKKHRDPIARYLDQLEREY